MEHILLLDVTIGYKELAISRSLSDDMIIHTNQLSASIDIGRNGDGEISFGSRKSCNKMSIEFGKNTNYKIRMNPPRTIGITSPHITNMKSVTGIGFGCYSCDGIPPSDIGSFDLFGRGTLYFSYSSTSWHGKKGKVKTLKATYFPKTLGTRII